MIMHWPGAFSIISIAYVLSIVYVIIGLLETYQSKNKSLREKGAWLIGFLFLTPIAGVMYYLTEIKRENPSM